jgi:hypothetical protein
MESVRVEVCLDLKERCGGDVGCGMWMGWDVDGPWAMGHRDGRSQVDYPANDVVRMFFSVLGKPSSLFTHACLSGQTQSEVSFARCAIATFVFCSLNYHSIPCFSRYCTVHGFDYISQNARDRRLSPIIKPTYYYYDPPFSRQYSSTQYGDYTIYSHGLSNPTPLLPTALSNPCSTQYQ